MRYQRPSLIERIFNMSLGKLLAIGIGPRHMRLLQVRGRRSGRIIQTPVDVLNLDAQLFLVAPRGETQWVRNARVSKQVGLKRGNSRADYELTELEGDDHARVLKAYLTAFVGEVQGYFPLQPDAPLDDFLALRTQYPAFRLSPL